MTVADYINLKEKENYNDVRAIAGCDDVRQ
jgi:hypothetical protein